MEKRFCDKCEAVITGDYFSVQVVQYGYAVPAGGTSDIVALASDLCVPCYEMAREYLDTRAHAHVVARQIGEPARLDANHRSIVKAIRQVGASVQSLASVGDGCPDLLVGWRGKNYIFEVKVKVGSATLTRAEWKWLTEWQGQSVIVRTAEEALCELGITSASLAESQHTSQ